MENVGIIGGSGFYTIDAEKIGEVDTPFGKSGEIVLQKSDSKNIYFLARHGKEHSVPPHLINYRANVYALKSLEVTKIFATNAVGSTRDELTPGSFVIPDNIIDLTSGRQSTYFEGTYDKSIPKEFQKVVHVDVSEPFSNLIRQKFIAALEKMQYKYFPKGTIAVSNGPRYETPAEVNLVKILGGDILGMTSAPEVFLAKELAIDYATIAVVTNYGAGMQQTISHQEVVEMFNRKIQQIKDVVFSAIEIISSSVS